MSGLQQNDYDISGENDVKTIDKNENFSYKSIQKKNVKSAGAIIIDPWENMYNYKNYNILCIKQRLGMSWGLPKGHLEGDEPLYNSAIRELYEETGINLKELIIGKDYLPVKLSNDIKKEHFNHVVIKKIHFFVFVLLKRGKTFSREDYDKCEIADVSWINVNSNKLLQYSNRYNNHFESNRTLSESSIAQLCDICRKTCAFLKNNLKEEDILRGHNSIFKNIEEGKRCVSFGKT